MEMRRWRPFLLLLPALSPPAGAFCPHTRRLASSRGVTKPATVPGTVASAPSRPPPPSGRRRRRASASDGDAAAAAAADFPGEALLEAARADLPWETVEARERDPVLDLSRLRDEGAGMSLAEGSGARGDGRRAVEADTERDRGGEGWSDGSVWRETSAGLREIGLFSDPSSADNDDSPADGSAEQELLAAAPQLLRLETATVLQTAEAIFEAGFSADVIAKQPALLTYPPNYISSGLEFLGTMMASPPTLVKSACKAHPALLLGAVEGWMQEQTVKRALGAAGDAADRANKRVVGDAAAAIKGQMGGLPGGGL